MIHDNFRVVVLEHASRYPLMQPADWYKLAFQGVFGSEHALGSVEMVHDHLEKEIARLGEGPEEPLLDPISGDGRIVRVHLRPYVQAAFPPEALAQAFMCTAAVIHGTDKELAECLAVIIEQARMENINIDPAVLGEYFQQFSDKAYPAVHHSPEFIRAYRPAYRVVARDFLPDPMITWKPVQG